MVTNWINVHSATCFYGMFGFWTHQFGLNRMCWKRNIEWVLLIKWRLTCNIREEWVGDRVEIDWKWWQTLFISLTFFSLSLSRFFYRVFFFFILWNEKLVNINTQVYLWYMTVAHSAHNGIMFASSTFPNVDHKNLAINFLSHSCALVVIKSHKVNGLVNK